MESKFKFRNPSLVEIQYIINNEFIANKDDEIKVSINMNVEVNRCDENNEATVSLIFELGSLENDCPYYIKVKEAAEFTWDESINNNTIDSLLHQNAPALLLSYIRPIVTQITSNSPYNTYNIPYINFTEFKPENIVGDTH